MELARRCRALYPTVYFELYIILYYYYYYYYYYYFIIIILFILRFILFYSFIFPYARLVVRTWRD
jgi:hypothetical protein